MNAPATTIERKLILIGGNAKICASIIQDECVFCYTAIHVFTRGIYEGPQANCLLAHEQMATANIALSIRRLVSESNSTFDMIVANTQPQSIINGMQRYDTLDFLTDLPLVLEISRIRKIIVLGSTLSLLPIFRPSSYVKLKNAEFWLTALYSGRYGTRLCYAFLPPLDSGKTLLASLACESRASWARRLIGAFEGTDKMMFPSSISGIISRALYNLRLQSTL